MAFIGNMRDRCKVLTHTSASAGPSPMSTYALGSEIRCRYARTDSKEVVDGSQMAPTNVEIRVPSGTTVTTSDRIRLTQLDGASVTQDYAILGEPFNTLGQLVLDCQLVTSGSAL